MKHLNYWRSFGRILSFKKELPILRVVSGIKKDEQSAYDKSPWLHGSNGTYVTNEPMFWHLVYIVYKPGPSELTGWRYELDLDDYMHNHFLPSRKWQRVSPQRLKAIHDKILGKKLELMSTEYVEKGEIAREFVPRGYDSWEEYLDEVLKDIE
jgi:hypothetical protein